MPSIGMSFNLHKHTNKINVILQKEVCNKKGKEKSCLCDLVLEFG